MKCQPSHSVSAFLVPTGVLAAWLLIAPASAGAAEGGLVLVPEPRLLTALLVLFVLLIFPVNHFVFKPLLRVLDERESRIEGTRTRAERIEQDAANTLAQYEAAVRETRGEAEQKRRGLLEEVRGEVQRETGGARGEAERLIEQARADVNASLDEARSGLRAQAEGLARQAASQVLGRSL